MDIRTQNLQKKIHSIREFIYAKIYSFENIRFKQGEITGAEQPQFDDSNWEEFRVGQFWGGKDVTCWFRIPFQVQEKIQDGKLAAIIQPGRRIFFRGSEGGDLREYELMVYLDRQPLQSVDVRRNEIPLWDKVNPGEDHLLAIEAFSGLETHQHKFEQADLVLINEEVEDFYYNTKMAFDTIQAVGDDHPESSRLFRVLEKTLLMVDFLQEGGSAFFESISRANNFIQQELYSDLPPKNKLPAVVSVGHAHLDIAWKWQTKHSRKKSVRTFANALRLMELYPEYRFLQSQPLLYKYVKESHPSLFEQVKGKIQTDQWEATGGMWVEADCNIPSGESLVRQFLFGKRYFKNEFGIDCKVVWLPDGFGFCYSLPQIIKKSGMRYFMTTKLSWSQFTKFPYDTFYWQGLDGTRILSHFITTPDPRGWNDYSVDLNPISVKNCWDNYHQQQENSEVLLSFGWGDGGGGPIREMQENAQRLNYRSPIPYHRQGSVEAFFADLEQRVEKLPVWNDELYLQLHRGCYTSQARIKKNNRQSEVLYHNAELFSAINFLQTGSYPHEELNYGWELILLNQFHDILPGSSIPEVYQDSEREFEQIKAIGQQALDKALTQIGSKNAASGGHNKLVVFNPLSWQRSDLIRMSIKDLNDFEIVDSQGKIIPLQKIADNEALFCSTETPSMGYQSYEIRESKSPPLYSSNIKVSENHLETQFFAIELDNHGLIRSIYDKRANREIIEKGKAGNVLQVFEDRPLANDAWDIDIYYQDKCLELAEIVEIRVVEEGPVRGGLFLKRKFLDSTIAQHIYVYDGIPRIDFKTEIDWQQHQTLLKVAFPVNVHSNKATYEIPYGNIERPTHWNSAWDWGRFEVPAQKWADLSEGDYGVSLLNDCKYGYDIKDNVMRLTLIKSAINPDPNADIGHHEFCYALYPHQGDWRRGDTIRMAYEFNHPLLTQIVKSQREQSSESGFSFVKINPENVIIETVKKAEDSDGIIVRVYEAYNQRGDAELEFAYPLKRVAECSLMEEIEKTLAYSGNKFKFYIKPYEIKTYLVEF